MAEKARLHIRIPVLSIIMKMAEKATSEGITTGDHTRAYTRGYTNCSTRGSTRGYDWAIPDIEDLGVLCRFPDGRKGQTLHVGSQAADVLSQGLGQHVNTPLNQVTGRRPAADKAMACGTDETERKEQLYAVKH